MSQRSPKGEIIVGTPLESSMSLRPQSAPQSSAPPPRGLAQRRSYRYPRVVASTRRGVKGKEVARGHAISSNGRTHLIYLSKTADPRARYVRFAKMRSAVTYREQCSSIFLAGGTMIPGAVLLSHSVPGSMAPHHDSGASKEGVSLMACIWRRCGVEADLIEWKRCWS